MNRKLAFDNRLCYERDVARQHAVHQRKIEEVLVTSQSPSKAFLDSNAPAPQRHLATNGKRLQLERDKQFDIFHQNQRLASKMERIFHRQENAILAASASSTARSPSPAKSHARGPLRPPQTAEGRAVTMPTPDVISGIRTPTTPSSHLHRSPRQVTHSPAHVHMPGIRLDASQTPLIDCHLSPEFAMGRGDACKKPSLVNRAVQKRRQAAIEVENRRLKERLGRLKPYYDTKKWDDEWQDHAHKFNHLHQDGTVGYLLPPPSKKPMPSSRGGCKTSRESGAMRGSTPSSRGLPSLGGNKRSVSRGDQLQQQQQSIRLKPVRGSRKSSAEAGDAELEEDEEMQVRELAHFTLLEATTRQGVAIVVNELQIEVLRAPTTCPGVVELGDRGLMVLGSWKDGARGELRVYLAMLVQVAQVVADLELMIKLETVTQVPNAGNIPRLSTLLTEDELQKLLLGVVQHLRFQVAPTTPNTSSIPQLVISWGLSTGRTLRELSGDAASSIGDGARSPQQRPRPSTCPSTIPSNSEHQRDAALLYDDDDDEMTCAIDGDADPLEIDWAVRFKMASMLNLEGRCWRTILRKDSGIYLVSSWFEEETGVQTIKTIAVGKAAMGTTSWVVEVVYDLSEMEELVRQLEGGTLTVPELLAEKVTHLLP